MVAEFLRFLAEHKDGLTVVRDFIGLGVAVVSVVTARQALNSWRRKHDGEANFELARKILASAFRLNDALDSLDYSVAAALRAEADGPWLLKGQSEEEYWPTVREYWMKKIDAQCERAKSHELEMGECGIEARVLWSWSVSSEITGLSHHYVTATGRAHSYRLRFSEGTKVGPARCPDDPVETVLHIPREELEEYFAEKRHERAAELFAIESRLTRYARTSA